VPTLATYEALGDEGERLGWSASMLAKLARVRDRGVEAIRIARAEGIPIVFGSDLLGAMQSRQSREFLLRLPAQTPLEILQGATSVAARLLRQEGQIGVVVAGAFADLLVVDGDPTRTLDMFAEPEAGLRLILQGGRCVKDRLPGPA
jgi:imidazolonepropionase-like amidohydrolase